MVEKQLKAMFLNGSPRKNKNTAQMLESAMKGAQEAGSEVELVHLQDLNFKGCVSCFACKRKGNTCGGLCIQKDDLRPILERILEADVLVAGSPIYWHNSTGMFRNFVERLFFPILSYNNADEHGLIKYLDKKMLCGIIYTMNVPNDYYYNLFHYHEILEPVRVQMEAFFGYCEQLEARNTWQFYPDYSKFDASAVDMEQKQWFRDNQWPKDLQNAYDLGKRLVEKAVAGNK